MLTASTFRACRFVEFTAIEALHSEFMWPRMEPSGDEVEVDPGISGQPVRWSFFRVSYSYPLAVAPVER